MLGVGGGELLEAAAEHRFELVLGQRAFGRGDAVGRQVKHGGLGVARQLAVVVMQLLFTRRLGLALAQRVQQCVAHDLVDPGERLARAAKGGAALPHLDHGLLHHVLGRLPAAQRRRSLAVEARAVLAVDHAQPGLDAAAAFAAGEVEGVRVEVHAKALLSIGGGRAAPS